MPNQMAKRPNKTAPTTAPMDESVRQKNNPSKDYKTNHPNPGMQRMQTGVAKRGRPEVPHIEDYASSDHPKVGTNVSHNGRDFGESQSGDFYTDK